MKQLSEIDKNFKIEPNFERDNLCFYDSKSEPFRIYGLLHDDNGFYRLPRHVAKEVSEGVSILNTNTAGGRIRFVTDSTCVAISAQMDRICKVSHFALTGTSGFDLYVDEGRGPIFIRPFIPPYEMEKGYESRVDIPGERMERQITINFPLYSDVNNIWIGLDKNATVKRAPDYQYEQPIVYYGSSITQGGCASRPGNAYPAIISRLMDCNYVNLGFTGSAKGEPAIAEYIASLDMRVFVMDYDHNAPTVAHLEKTHEAMYKLIRNAQPSLPIILLSRPKMRLTAEESERLEVIKRTYQKAVLSGDQNIYLLPGTELIADEIQEIATVDGCHPNDCGFMRMAYVLRDHLKDLFQVKRSCFYE